MLEREVGPARSVESAVVLDSNRVLVARRSAVAPCRQRLLEVAVAIRIVVLSVSVNGVPLLY